jgi:conjugal transfer pilin signal peptidase TrbI
VRAPHPDSLDSRYALTGWVTQAQIIGRAHVLF